MFNEDEEQECVCGAPGSIDPHPCPYKVAMGDLETECHCCSSCTRDCKADI